VKNMPLKVLQLISSGGYYGAENMLLNLCASQESAGCRHSLLLFYNVHAPNVELYERARRRGITVRMVHCKGRADWRAVREIRQYIAQDQIDLVHTHGYKADLYGYLAARGMEKPIVATCHNWVGGTAALAIYNRVDRMVLKRFNAIAAVSDAVKERLLQCGIAPAAVKTIANGIDVEAFSHAEPPESISRQTKIIGMVARLDLKKGFEYLLLAVHKLHKTFKDFKVVITGEGPDRPAIEQMIEHYGLQQSVTLAGARSDMPNVYAAMDIFVLPSLNEGLPMTLLEAMAAGKPVIASRVGAIPDVVEDGANGLLVTPGDSSGLCDALARLLNAPDLCRRMASQAHEWVGRNFTSEIMAKRYRLLYDEVLERDRAIVSARSRHDNGRANARSA
jgi:glycosyltransferase involved in cell wall biosynthesis